MCGMDIRFNDKRRANSLTPIRPLPDQETTVVYFVRNRPADCSAKTSSEEFDLTEGEISDLRELKNREAEARPYASAPMTSVFGRNP